IHPVRSELYRSSAPRALVVSGYRNVVINHFLFAGDPFYDYKGQTAASIQFRAANVVLANGVFRGFRNAKTDISVASDSNNVQNVLVKNIHSSDSAPEIIRLGKDESAVTLENLVKIKN